MKILALLGSPRKNGNSEFMTQAVITAFTDQIPAEVEYVRLPPLKIAPCIGCGGCEKTGMCVVTDKMIELYAKLDEADIILLASPTYFYGLSAQSKACIDRAQARWSRKYLLKERFRRTDKRRGYLLCTAATKGKKLFDGSVLVAKSFFDALDVDYGGELLVRGVDEKGAAERSSEDCLKAREFAQGIADYFNR